MAQDAYYLRDAVWHNDLREVQALVGLGHVPLNARDRSGRTALHCAAQVGNAFIVRALLRAGASPLWRADEDGDYDDYGDNDSEEAVEMDAEGEEEYNNGDGPTPLHLAAAWGNLEAVEAILEFSEDIDVVGSITNSSSGPALLHALWLADSPDVAAALLDYGADVNALDRDERNILHYCAARPGEAFLGLMQRAVVLGADVNRHCNSDYRDKEKTGIKYAGTPLHFAIQTGFHEAVVFLLASGAQLSPSEAFGRTIPPLLLVPIGGNLDTLRHLVSLGCDIANDVDDRGKTFLHFCVAHGKDDTFEPTGRAAVELGADIHRADNEGNQPLHDAAKSGGTKKIGLLLELGARVNALGNEGKTPLHMAVARSNLRAAIHLIFTARCDALLRDNAGKTALNVSAERFAVVNSPPGQYNHMKIMTVLVAAGDRQWDLIPTPCHTLEAALSAVAENAADDLGELFQRLQEHVQVFIRNTLLALHRVFPAAPQAVQLAILGAALPTIDSLPDMQLPRRNWNL